MDLDAVEAPLIEAGAVGPQQPGPVVIEDDLRAEHRIRHDELEPRHLVVQRNRRTKPHHERGDGERGDHRPTCKVAPPHGRQAARGRLEGTAVSRIVQRTPELCGIREAVRLHLAQRGSQGCRHVGGHGRPQGFDRQRLSRHDLRDDALRRRGGEGRLTAEHLVQYAAEGVDVRAAVEMPVAHRLLRAHVLGRADGHARFGQPLLPVRRGEGEGDAEVGNDRMPLVQQDVRGLDVAMDDALAMRVIERARERGRVAYSLRNGKVLLPGEPVLQRFARDERHHVEGGSVHLPGVDQAEDVRVLQVRGGPDLGEESLGPDGGGEVRPQHLDRDCSLVADVAREVDGGHTADTQLALDLIAAGERGGEPAHRIRRRLEV